MKEGINKIQPCNTDHVTREEMIVYTKKIMDIAEDRARDSIRITVIEKLCEDMDKKFDFIQKKLDTLTSRKKIKGGMHIGMSFIIGTLFPTILDNLPHIVDWADKILNR
jgi:hypothetical protein